MISNWEKLWSKNIKQFETIYASIVVEDRVVDAFIDTGADCTFISEKLRENIT